MASLVESLSTIQQQIQNGDRKPTEVLEDALKRCQKGNDKLNAFLTLDHEQAIVRAQYIEKNWSKFKHQKMVGLPIGIKDNILKTKIKKIYYNINI